MSSCGVVAVGLLVEDWLPIELADPLEFGVELGCVAEDEEAGEAVPVVAAAPLVELFTDAPVVEVVAAVPATAVPCPAGAFAACAFPQGWPVSFTLSA